MKDLTKEDSCTPFPRERGFQIPKFIMVGSHKIPITRKHMEDAYGMFDPEKMEITIGIYDTKSIENETFWHEVVECLNFFVEAGIEHKSIQAMGVLLHQIITSMEDG